MAGRLRYPKFGLLSSLQCQSLVSECDHLPRCSCLVWCW